MAIKYPLLEAYVKLRREVSLIGAVKLKESEMGQKQMQILYRLTEAPRTMSELADFTQSDKASTTRTVDSLAKEGLVRRLEDKTDRRKCVIALTAKGERRAEKAQEIREYIGERLNKMLSAGERETLTELLNKAAAGLAGQRK
jgi:DNA-binding MarR family transcriptional regulator